MRLADQSHPEPDQLAQYSLGKLNDEETAHIEEHVARCEECARTVVGMSGDTFIGLLRRQELSGTQATEFHGPAITESRVPPIAREHVTLAPLVGTTKLSDEAIRRVLELPAELRQHSRYQIQECLGVGGMGCVYKAQHRIMNRPVALKVINPQLLNQPGAAERFEREVQTAARLSHPNIVTAHDADHAGGLHFLVMEYVEGIDLHQMVQQRGPLPVAEACEYIRQAALGLQHAYQQGMVHRDIKPHNLMYVGKESWGGGQEPDLERRVTRVVKILDFGLANFASDTAAEELVEGCAAPGGSKAQLTMLGSMMGTPDYIAPEQAADAHTVDIRADIYSLGCTLYCLLAGRAPFHEGTVFDKIKAHSQQEAPSLAAIRTDVPLEVEAIVRKMMAKSAGDRYQVPQEVVDALETVEAASTTPALTRAFLQRRRPRLLTALAVFFAAAVLAAAVFFVQTNHGVVRVEVADETLEVRLSGNTITTQNDGQQISIRAGHPKLVVRRGNFEFETEGFQLKRGDVVALKVELIRNEIVLSKDGEKISGKALPRQLTPRASDAEPLVVTLTKDGRYLVGEQLMDDANDFSNRLNELLKADIGREVLIESAKAVGIEPVRQLEALVRQTGATRVGLPSWVEEASKQSSQFLTSLGDLQAVVRKALGDEGLTLRDVNSTENAGSVGPRRELVLQTEVVGEQDRAQKIFPALADKLKLLASSTDAFISDLEESREGEINRFHLTYSTPTREGVVRLERAAVGAEKRMPKIHVWRVSIRVEEWPQPGTITWQMPESLWPEPQVEKIRLAQKLGGRVDVCGLAYLPDGRTLTAVSGQIPELHVWNLELGRVEIAIPLPFPIRTAAISAGGKLAIVAEDNLQARAQRIQCYDLSLLATNIDENSDQIEKDFVQSLVPADRKSYEILKWKVQPEWTISLEQPPVELTWFQDGKAFLVRDQRGRVSRYRSSDGAFVVELAAGGIEATSLAPNGILCFIKLQAGAAQLLRTDDGSIVNQLKMAPATHVTATHWCADGRCVATGDAAGRIELWNLASGESVTSFSNGSVAVANVLIDAKRTRIYSGDDRGVAAWDLRGRLLARGKAEDFQQRFLALSPDEKSLLRGGQTWRSQRASGSDHSLQLWRLPESVQPSATPAGSATFR